MPAISRYILSYKFSFIFFMLTTSPTLSNILKDEHSLSIVKKVIQQIKDDPDNPSYRNMLEDARAEHSIKYHLPNRPFFYSNDRYVIKDIIDLVLDEPDGIVDNSKKTGIFMVYRDNIYHDEIEELFDREPLYKRNIPQPRNFQRDFLGLTITGPTNRVMVVLKIKGDEQFADTLEKRLAYIGNNIIFVDAFPVKKAPISRRPNHHPKGPHSRLGPSHRKRSPG